MLPDQIEFVHGPGCPVCVLPMGRVDDCVALAERPEVIFTTFGDAMRVPGSRKSLLKAKADGADVRMVYSPLDALAIARKNPDREVVFFGLGFETTMPSIAMTVIEARRQGLCNFSLFCNHITIIPTIRAILDSPDLRLDGFLGPGHVSMVIGTECYDFIARDYRKPITVAGFEPLDVLHALWMVVSRSLRAAPRWRTSTAASCPDRATRRRSRPSRRFMSCASSSSGAAWARSTIPGCGCARAMRSSTPNVGSTCPTCGWPTPRRASAARF